MQEVNSTRFSVPLKGIILVCLPLITELVLVLTMTNLVNQAEADATLAMRSAKVIELGHRLVELAFAAESGCQGYAFTGNPLYKEMFNRAITEFPVVLKTLRERPHSSPEQKEAQEEIQAMSQRYLSIVNYDMTPAGLAQEESSLSAEVLSMLQNRIEDFLGEEEDIQEKRYAAQSHARQGLNQFVFVAVGCNVLMAVLLSLFFTANITRRLGVLIKNTNLLSSGRPLNPPVGGQDEITQLDRVFHEMAESLARAEQAKREFVAMVSHDLKVPLTAIQLFLQALLGEVFGEVPERLRGHALGAERNSERLLKLIKDLLDIEKLESGTVELQLEQVQMDELIENSAKSVFLLANEHKVSIKQDCIERITVTADGDRIVQVLTNLLSNAVKFSPENSIVEISSKKEAGFIEVRVTDHGRGIPSELQKEVFERFKQAYSSDARELEGTGLGLAICQRLIEKHGGNIGVRSDVGAGSTFWFRIPLEQSEHTLVPPVTGGTNA